MFQLITLKGTTAKGVGGSALPVGACKKVRKIKPKRTAHTEDNFLITNLLLLLRLFAG
jgi:hypothetical protein